MTDRRSLVVVVPGIGGSVLARPGRPDQVLWDAGKGDIAGLAWRPGLLGLDEAPYLEPIGLTESTKFLGFTLVPGYEKLLDQLTGTIDRRGDPQDPLPGADVVAVPYDFRRGIVEAALRLDAVVCAHLADYGERERAGVVTVVGHSMGGLVARVWLGLFGRWPWCRSLITVGTPHRGAPKALGWLVNGVPLLGATTRMLRSWPSVVELLPRYPAVHDAATGTACYPHDLPVPWLSDRARTAYQLHLLIERACDDMPRRGPETVACIGWSHATPRAAFWENERLRVSKKQPDWLGLHGWEDDFGDGTVPAFCALPPEMDQHEHSPVRLPQRHVPLAHAPVVAELLARQRHRRPPSAVRGPQDGERPPAIGLDLDDVHEAGAPIQVTVALRQLGAGRTDRPVWARLRVPGSAPVDVRLGWDDTRSSFVGELPGQAPGLYEVRVQAREVPGAGDLHASDTVAVVEGD
jgi:pimeloyl-ACP methyl ester carboxylesterase